MFVHLNTCFWPENRGGLAVARILLTLTLLLCLVLTAVAGNAKPTDRPSQGEQETVRQILELERQSKDATIHRDAEFAERTLADDYIAIGPLGQITTKSDTISARKRSQLHYDAIEISELVVRVYGKTAVVTGRVDVKGSELGEDFTGPYRFTRIWVKREGHWEAVSYQMTVTR